MTHATGLPDEDDVGFGFGSYISILRKAGSYHWYSRTGSLHQVRDYVWDLMELRQGAVVPGVLSTTAADGSLEFIGVETRLGNVLTCFWRNEAGIDLIQGAVRREWEGMMSELERGAFMGLPWDVRNTLMMFGEIDPQKGLPELYDFLQDGRVRPLVAETE